MAGKIRKLILSIYEEDPKEPKTRAGIDCGGQIIQWDGTLEEREAVKPALEAIWLALASDGFLMKEAKPNGQDNT